MNQQHPHHPHDPNQPAWPPGGCNPPPQPPKKTNVGKVIGLGCAGVIGLVVLIGVIGVAAGGDSDKDDETTSSAPVTVPDAGRTADDLPKQDDAKATSSVTLKARKTSFSKSILASDSNYTSVLVTLTNNGHEPLDVNPLFFTITDTNGTKHTHELAADEQQIDTVKLAPGENISGTVTGKATFTPKYVTFTNGFLGDSYRADVS
ncbi:DUF4352 domain-containing protein [Streptomyces longwoodensis]|uniref:DUF4352 domain-containing protein n=1 Tax=Streptomyces longwoodensis TaxID=68231 RepID=UPI002253EF46|nr:DUF4352 domain-containing protein [Streptomyces longwoodensis]MCX4994313.1 DUF4352 domain-containing protein [Streptomyces longwoodensis]